jgi:hypothetical protein
MSIAKKSIFSTTILPSPSKPKAPDPHAILLLPKEKEIYKPYDIIKLYTRKKEKPSST